MALVSNSHRYNLFSSLIVGMVLFFILPPTCLHAQSSFQDITTITIAGNARVDEKIIREIIGSAPGIVSRQQINEDIKKLYQTGYFEQVQAKFLTWPAPVQNSQSDRVS